LRKNLIRTLFGTYSAGTIKGQADWSVEHYHYLYGRRMEEMMKSPHLSGSYSVSVSILRIMASSRIGRSSLMISHIRIGDEKVSKSGYSSPVHFRILFFYIW